MLKAESVRSEVQSRSGDTETTAAADITAPFVVIDRRHHMTLTRKPFAEFAVELAAGLRAGRGDEPIGRERQVQGDRGGAPF